LVALNTAKTTTKAPIIGPLNTTQRSMNADQVAQGKPSAPPTKVNVANLMQIKKLPPKNVGTKIPIPANKMAQLPAVLNTKKMG